MGLIINGVDLKSEYNFVTRSVMGRGFPGADLSAVTMPRVDGSIPSTWRFTDRTITIRGTVWGRTTQEALQKKEGLLRFLSSAAFEEVELTFPDTNRSIYVRFAGDMIDVSPIGPVYAAYGYDITLTFVARDPFFYSGTQTLSLSRFMSLNSAAPIYLISPKRLYLRREPAVEIEPITLVNLAGRYGDFDLDSNSDGLADGWSQINATGYAIVSGTQKITYSGVGTGSTGSIYTTVNLPAYHKFFTRVVGYRIITDPPTSADYVALFISGIASVQWPSTGPAVTELCAVGTQTSASTITVYLRPFGYISSSDTKECQVYWDKFAVYDLTEMGSLPVSLQRYLNRQNWEDLATSNPITAVDGRSLTGIEWLAELLPFCNSVASAGYSWGKEVTWIIRRGKQLVVSGEWKPVRLNGGKAYIVNSTNTKVVTAGNRITASVGANDAGVGVPVWLLRKRNYALSCRNLGSRAITLRVTEYFDPDHVLLDFMAASSYAVSVPPGDTKTLSFTSSSNYAVLSLEASDTIAAELDVETQAVKIESELWKVGNYADKLIDNFGTLEKVQRCKRELKTTNSSGAISLSNYLTGSKCIVVNNENGQVKVLDASSTVSTGWANKSVTVIYCTAAQELSKVSYTGELKLSGTNTVYLENAVLGAFGRLKHLEG